VFARASLNVVIIEGFKLAVYNMLPIFQVFARASLNVVIIEGFKLAVYNR
jgi:molybdopterin-guanine dinucleotide biosynthesis protein